MGIADFIEIVIVAFMIIFCFFGGPIFRNRILAFVI